jgi:hypothetical protein
MQQIKLNQCQSRPTLAQLEFYDDGRWSELRIRKRSRYGTKRIPSERAIGRFDAVGDCKELVLDRSDPDEGVD